MNIDCSICTDRIQSGAVSTKCGHIFHGSCLDKWLERSRSCPVCRTNTGNSEVQKLTMLRTAARRSSQSPGTISFDRLKAKKVKLQAELNMNRIILRSINDENSQTEFSIEAQKTHFADMRKEMTLLKGKDVQIQRLTKHLEEATDKVHRLKSSTRELQDNVVAYKNEIRKKRFELSSKTKSWKIDILKLKQDNSRLKRLAEKAKAELSNPYAEHGSDVQAMITRRFSTQEI